jgi:hypothetical protein
MPTPSSRPKVISLVDARGPNGHVHYSALVQHAGTLYRVSVGLDLHDPRRSVAYALDPTPADPAPVLAALAAALRYRALERRGRGDSRAGHDVEAAERLRLAMQRVPIMAREQVV